MVQASLILMTFVQMTGLYHAPYSGEIDNTGCVAVSTDFRTKRFCCLKKAFTVKPAYVGPPKRCKKSANDKVDP